jgi:uncharacterized membrane protein YecN with MAPEG domain
MVTALYAGILGLMAIAVAFPAGSLRGKLNIPIGDGGNMELIRCMRRQANFIEWVPLVLILIGLLEMSGVSKTAIHVLGAGLVVARVCHALDFRANTMQAPGRAIGAAGSALITVVASIWLIVRYFG